MSSSGLTYGLNLTKKLPGSRPPPAKRKKIFDEEDDSDGNETMAVGVEEIGEIDGLEHSQTLTPSDNGSGSNKSKIHSKGGTKKGPVTMYGDLSADFTSKKHATVAEELDTNIYDYDGIYDSLKPQKKESQEDKERKPKYMSNLLAAAAVRKRDATIAEEKKLAREREAEGDEFADKEKFVTSAYKKQQEENRRMEEEERMKEEREAKKNKGAGMTNFYKNMLEKGEQKHAEVVKAVDERIRNGPVEEAKVEKEKTAADIAREINAKKAGAIAVNEEGEVVDKRQLLNGGLNIVAKAKSTAQAKPPHSHGSSSDRNRSAGFVGAGGSKQAMRERQSRMIEAQLEQANKRALEEEEEEKTRIERASKSQKTEGEIMSAKERYLARKREAEEAKKKTPAHS